VQPLKIIQPDGLIESPCKEHSEKKYGLIRDYGHMFSKSMKGKWYRVYIDLFSGSGHARVDKKTLYFGSPLLALTQKYPFEKYIFCEKDKNYMSALEKRVESLRPEESAVEFFDGDVNSQIGRVMNAVPDQVNGKGVLVLCFVDPYRISDIQFSTIKRLSDLQIDFMILIPSYMDAHRNPKPLLKLDNPLLDDYLGDTDWRVEWKSEGMKGKDFGLFVIESLCRRVTQLPSSRTPKHFQSVVLSDSTVQVNAAKTDSPLYHLAFFSRHSLGIKFWEEAKRDRQSPSLF